MFKSFRSKTPKSETEFWNAYCKATGDWSVGPMATWVQGNKRHALETAEVQRKYHIRGTSPALYYYP